MDYPTDYLTNREGVVHGDWTTTDEEADRAADVIERNLSEEEVEAMLMEYGLESAARASAALDVA